MRPSLAAQNPSSRGKLTAANHAGCKLPRDTRIVAEIENDVDLLHDLGIGKMVEGGVRISHLMGFLCSIDECVCGSTVKLGFFPRRLLQYWKV